MLDSYFEYLDKNNFIESDIAIHCDTKEKAEYLISMYSSSGKAWSPTSPLITSNNEFVTRWGKDKGQTCYRVNENDFNFLFKSIASSYEKKGVMVIEFEELFPYIELTEEPVVEEEQPKKKSKLFGKKKNEDNSSNKHSMFEPKAEEKQAANIDSENDSHKITESDYQNSENQSIDKVENNSESKPSETTDFEKSVDTIKNTELNNKADNEVNKSVEEVKTVQNEQVKEPEQKLSESSVKTVPIKPTSNVSDSDKTLTVNNCKYAKLPIMRKFKVNDDLYRLNDSLICEKCLGTYWYPILDIEKYISLLNHLKKGDIEYVD